MSVWVCICERERERLGIRVIPGNFDFEKRNALKDYFIH